VKRSVRNPRKQGGQEQGQKEKANSSKGKRVPKWRGVRPWLIADELQGSSVPADEG
jgi:hypothetical protein